MNGWQAFRTGLAHTLRYWQVLLVLFAANLLSASLLVLLPALSLASGLGHRPAIRQAADGVDAWFVIETMMSSLANEALEQEGAETELTRGLQQTVLSGSVIAAVLPLLAGLPAAFLNGGLLLVFLQARQPFRWRRFLWGCWHWFGTFLLLGLVQGIVFALIFVPAIAVAAVAVVSIGRWLAWVAIPGLALVAVFGMMLIECARMVAVVERTRNPFVAFGRAVRFVFRHPLPVAGLYGLSVLLAGLLHLLFRLVLMPPLPLDWWPVVFLVQQTFVLARLGTRLVRLAGGVALIDVTQKAELRPRDMAPAQVP